MGSKTRWRGLLAALCLLVVLPGLHGCAATGPKGAEIAGRLSEIPPGYGRVVFFRTSSIVGAAVQPDILLDGQVVGKSQPGGFFYVDAAPGPHRASASTEVTSTLELPVLAGQTHYVRSAIGFGLLVGRVTLTIEAPAAAQGELPGLSYSGGHVPRVGTVATAAAALTPTAPPREAAPAASSPPVAAAAPTAPPAPRTTAQPWRRGDAVIYRVTDGYTRVTRDAVFVVERIDGERIVFAPGGRIETARGTVEAVGTPLAGEMDACSPPGGWGPPPATTPGMRWTLRFDKDAGMALCGGQIELQAQLVSEEVMPTAFGAQRIQRIDYTGTGSRQGFVFALDAKVWYAPGLGRLLRFESERAAAAGTRNAPATRERAELVEIRRD